jgi:hypothetical protein
MKQTTKKANVANNSNNVATVANVENLAPVQIDDATSTKGKATAKFNLNDQTEAEANLEKVDKNQLFSVELSDYFCPVKFDSSTLEANLQPLVNSGILSVDAMQKAIETAKKEYLEQHAEEIAKAQNMCFAEVVSKLQENETLYKKVLTACNVSTLEESCYIDDNGKVLIYRANQCQDKEGNDRYQTATLKRNENGREFSQPLFVEVREQTTANILLAIRYYASKQNAAKTLLNKVSDYKRILTYVFEAAKKAKDNGFSLEQVTEQVTKVFAEVEETK